MSGPLRGGGIFLIHTEDISQTQEPRQLLYCFFMETDRLR